MEDTGSPGSWRPTAPLLRDLGCMSSRRERRRALSCGGPALGPWICCHSHVQRAAPEQTLSGRLTPQGHLDGSPPLSERRAVQEEPRARPQAPLLDYAGRSRARGAFPPVGPSSTLRIPVGHVDPSPVDTVLLLDTHLSHVASQTLELLIL